VLFIREFTVRKHERGLLLRNGDFERFLAPAVYRFFDPKRRIEVERFDLTQPAFEHRLMDYLVRWQPEAVEDLFLRVETLANQVAVIYRNGHPWSVVPPEHRALFWRGVVHVKAELIDIASEIAVTPRLARTMLADVQAGRRSRFESAVLLREVPEAHVGLLFVDGQFVRELTPGLHGFWKIGRNVAVELIDQRVKALEVGEHELLTKDRACVRVYLNASYRFVNAPLTIRSLRDPLGFIDREIRAVLRNAVAKRSLDAVLEDKTAIDKDVLHRVHRKLGALGIDVRDIGVNELARIKL
jgi:regulator of protease activity HflC (stomatin/prohibitin superfamily)